MRYALRALVHSGYDGTTHVVEHFSYPGVPAALVSKLRARMAQVAGDTTISGQVNDLSNFRMEMTMGTTSLTIRARNGTYEGSENGGSFQQIPSSAADSLLNAVQSNSGSLAGSVVVKRTLKSGEINGIPIARYLVVTPGSTQDQGVSPIFSSVGASIPAKAFQAGPATGIVEIDARTHLLVQFAQHGTGAIRLALLHPGWAGELVYTGTTTATYSHVVPHAR